LAPHSAPGTRAKRDGALGNVRICDFTGQLAGAGATRVLAAFGAEVVRVEDPVRQGQWDLLRTAGPYIDERRGLELGGGFNSHNVEKLGVTINLRSEGGRALLRRLIAKCDVVTENFAAGVLARLGFSYEELCAIRPDIIYVSNCGFGQTGPYASFKTWGPVVQAICGLSFLSGLPDEPPAGWGYSFMDHMGANFMAVAVLAALVHRSRTGEGQWVDMSCIEAGIVLDGPALLDHSVNGRPARRPGSPDSNHSQFPSMAPHNIYPASGEDRWVAIACRDDEDWAAFARVLDEAWTRDEGFRTLAGRLAAEADLDRRISTWTAARDRFAVASELQSAGVPATAVQAARDRIENDPATAAWGLWPVVRHREIGEVRVEGIPVHLSDTDWTIEQGAPCLGQHNEVVFGGLLGLTADELDDLRAEGAI
jgi:crotonobetainyl-CoA:carnitine CoA-transferase CaiB-like acyl-CoA transferase